MGEPDGPAQPLEGGITNRNYRVSLGGHEYVIRVPGKDTNLLGIDRRAELVANERAAAIGVAPPVAAMLDEPVCIVTAFVEGEGLEAEDLREPRRLELVARSLRAIHGLADPLPTEFNSFRVVEAYAKTARERGARLPVAYEQALGYAGRIEAALTGPEHDPVPCHNDLLAGNFIEDAERIWIVDWEYAGIGDRYFDLANFSVNNELDEAGEAALLADYWGEPATLDRAAALRLMRFMSDFREAMWGVVQSAVSDIDFDYDAYAAKHFDRMLETAADPGFDRHLEEARGGTG